MNQHAELPVSTFGHAVAFSFAPCMHFCLYQCGTKPVKNRLLPKVSLVHFNCISPKRHDTGMVSYSIVKCKEDDSSG